MRRAAPAAEAALEAQEEAASEPPPEPPEQPEKQPPPPPPLSQQPPPAATAAALDMLRKLDPAQTEESAKAWESAFGMSPTPLPQWYSIQEGDIIHTGNGLSKIVSEWSVCAKLHVITFDSKEAAKKGGPNVQVKSVLDIGRKKKLGACAVRGRPSEGVGDGRITTQWAQIANEPTIEKDP